MTEAGMEELETYVLLRPNKIGSVNRDQPDTGYVSGGGAAA